MITIVDYGLGNIHAFSNMYKRLNIEARDGHDAPTNSRRADKLILPGVGAFDHAMDAAADARACAQTLDELVLGQQGAGARRLRRHADPRRAQRRRGSCPGLGWIDGRVRALSVCAEGSGLPLPHMGWNDVAPDAPGRRCSPDSSADARFYFLHSYYFECAHARGCRWPQTSYGVDFAAPCSRRTSTACSSTPRRATTSGTRLLQNFAEL